MRDDSFPTACDDATIEAIKAAMHRSDDEALAMLDQAIARHPADARLALLRGSVYASLGQYPGAFADLSQAIVMAPDLHAARFMLGYLELCHKGAAQALAVWQPLTQLDESQPLGDFARGLTQLVTGQPEQARAYLQRGLDGNRDHPELSPFIATLIEKSHEIVADAADAQAGDSALAAGIAIAEANPADGDEPSPSSHLLLGDYLARRDH
ncbi:tetratricopeptide repeat protein [Lysobacter gummosus]|jgi:tetratricopeptide (TPR) repeat protein|uniref:Tetratricopeptide repeat protein n=1 Tax=Lysobacter gummosus TaxID=262324 RepID=A0ABY3XDU5_9GAMM|nr:tetratricopeptide repeat protein [Lysobacter gummosus]ALN93538.1 tetratricopeptide repeat family protein [Lysobacter gummosus]UNP28986.1 tetratricopeptide repeat protein [Lysobacter gummosus]